MDIYAKLKELLSKQVRQKKFDVEKITPETRLEDLGLDSLDTAELLINIEQEFNLPEVTQDEMLDVKTVEDVKNLIEKKRA
ncbi:MAG TPA: acyl carrier protein [Candidatus Enterosoma merdigallinarum]|nr:acyl carrier protein [Candidatus Enterosoma merdigallinarum]